MVFLLQFLEHVCLKFCQSLWLTIFYCYSNYIHAILILSFFFFNLLFRGSSDWQLAMALQQQEFEQQPPQRQSESSGSRLVTGPQVIPKIFP